MTQPFWEVELAKQQGKLINQAMDYSPQSRTAPVIAMQPLTPSHAPSAWQPARTSPPAQTYAPASRSAPIVFRHPPAWKQTGTVRPAAARTAAGFGHAAPSAGGDARDGLPLDLGARLKSLKHPPGWLAAGLIVIAGYVGNQLRHPEASQVQADAINHPVVAANAKRAKSR